MKMSDQLHASATLPPGKRALRTHWVRGWVSPRDCLEAVAKRKFPAPSGNGTPVGQTVP